MSSRLAGVLLSERWALLRLCFGAALISFSGVFVKLVDVSATSSAFWRAMFGGIILTTWVLSRRRALIPRGRALVWLVIAGFAFAADLYFWHTSVLYIGVGLSTLLANFQVFVMAAAAVFVFGERMSRWQLVAIPMAMFGLHLIVGTDWGGLDQGSKLGVIFGLATAVAYTAYMLSLRQARWSAPYRDAASDLAVASLFTAGFLALGAAYLGESLALTTASDIGWLVTYAFIGQVLGWLCISSSLPFVPTAHIGLALLLQPTLSYVWDVVIFDRTLTATEVFGTAIAIVAIYLGSRKKGDVAT